MDTHRFSTCITMTILIISPILVAHSSLFPSDLYISCNSSSTFDRWKTPRGIRESSADVLSAFSHYSNSFHSNYHTNIPETENEKSQKFLLCHFCIRDCISTLLYVSFQIRTKMSEGNEDEDRRFLE